MAHLPDADEPLGEGFVEQQEKNLLSGEIGKLHQSHDAVALCVICAGRLNQAEFLALVDGRNTAVHMELVEYVLNVIAYRG